MPDITPERKQEIMKLIRKRTEQFANLGALPSTISGRKNIKTGLSLFDEMLGTPASEWPGIYGMGQTMNRLETDEEQEFFKQKLNQQRKNSSGKLNRVLRNLMNN